MKKVTLAIVTMFAATTPAIARIYLAIRVEAGANFANQTIKVGDKSIDGKVMIGYRAGVGIEFGTTSLFLIHISEPMRPAT